MLILTRKLGEAIAIGDDIKVYLFEVKGKQIRIGIEAPPHISIHREEVYRLIQEQNMVALEPAKSNEQSLRDIWDRLTGMIIKD